MKKYAILLLTSGLLNINLSKTITVENLSDYEVSLMLMGFQTETGNYVNTTLIKAEKNTIINQATVEKELGRTLKNGPKFAVLKVGGITYGKSELNLSLEQFNNDENMIIISPNGDKFALYLPETNEGEG